MAVMGQIPVAFSAESSAFPGWEAGAVHIGEVWRNTSGGVTRDDTWLTHTEVSLSLDTSEAGLWPNGQGYVSILNNGGDKKLSDAIVGDLQTVSNIEAPRTARLYELWYEHRWSEGSWAIVGGIHDANRDFAVTDVGGLFVNSSFGIGPDVSNGRPSIFPLAAPGMRLRWINSAGTWQWGLYDGDPGDPDTDEHYPRSTFTNEGGVLGLAQWSHPVRIRAGLEGLWHWGAWLNTGEFDDVTDTDPAGDPLARDGNYGVYWIYDQPLGADAGAGFFLQAGINRPDVNEIAGYWGAGYVLQGLIRGRPDDLAGLAVNQAFISPDLNHTGGRSAYESVLEMTYSWKLHEAVQLQPNVQYVVHPGGRDDIDDAIVAGLRWQAEI